MIIFILIIIDFIIITTITTAITVNTTPIITSTTIITTTIITTTTIISRPTRSYSITRAQSRGKSLLNPASRTSWLNALMFIIKLMRVPSTPPSLLFCNTCHMYMLAPCFVRVFQGNWIPKRCGTARQTDWTLFMGDTWPDVLCVLCHWYVRQLGWPVVVVVVVVVAMMTMMMMMMMLMMMIQVLRNDLVRCQPAVPLDHCS